MRDWTVAFFSSTYKKKVDIFIFSLSVKQVVERHLKPSYSMLSLKVSVENYQPTPLSPITYLKQIENKRREHNFLTLATPLR